MTEQRISIGMSDGERIAVTLYVPDGDGPFPAILEALPYRKDDVTLAYETEYRRLRDEGRFVVCRADVRGTGSSSGLALDEYTTGEHRDWLEVIDWLATRPWSLGTVGMYGTSYSGFNSLQVAALRPPALKAIVSIYATDSRFTDDVHYGGGAHRGIDLVDYPHYMTALNALPPVPGVYGEGWRDEWRRRLDGHVPWLLRWSEEQRDGDYWLHGSVKTDYQAIEAATMIVAGWADGYHNMAFRTLAALDAPAHLLAGPWSHMDTAVSIPGPHIDLVPELIAWFDRWLRDDHTSPAATWPRVRAFMRRFTTPEPDLAIHRGEWRAETRWPAPSARTTTLPLGSGTDRYVICGDVGFSASIWCAASMPWGTPMDQREDDARSLRYEWNVPAETAILGHPELQVTVRSSVPVTYLSAKLCDVAPDGTSALVSRGILNLAHRDSHASPTPLVAGRDTPVTIELDATSWIFEPGHTIRLSLATSDWPSSWAPPLGGEIAVVRDRAVLVLPELAGPASGPAPTFTDPAPGPPAPSPGHQTVWRAEHDVLARERRVTVEYGTPEPRADDPLAITDLVSGTIRVSTTDPGRSRVDATFHQSISYPEVTAAAASVLRFSSDADAYRLELALEVTADGEVIHARAWDRSIPRDLQ